MLSVNNGRARKQGRSEVLGLEAQKSRLAARIGKESGLFYVPEVLGFQPEEGTLEMEWLPELEGLISLALKRDPQLVELCERAGAALSVIHHHLNLPQEFKIPFPEPPSFNEGVFLHGDFNGDNVCYDRRKDRLVIVDWSSAPLFGGRPTFGSRYFDVTWFGHFFFCSRPARWMGDWQDVRCYEALIRGYMNAAPSSFSNQQLHDFRSAAEPVFSAARRQMLRSVPPARRAIRAVVLWQAKARWRRCALNFERQPVNGNGQRPR